MSGKFEYLAKNTLVLAISSFGTKFLAFFMVPLYTNVLTTEEYGIADLIATTATLMIYIFTINIAEAVLRFALERKQRQEEILSYGLRITGIGSIVFAIVLGIVCWSGIIGWDAEYFSLLFFFFITTAIYQLLTSHLRAVDQVTDVAIAGVISSLTLIICNIILLLVVRMGICGYLISMSMGPLVGSAYAFVRTKLKPHFFLRTVCDKATRKEMRSFSVPLIFNNIAVWLNGYLDKYFVTALCGIAQNGIYAVAGKIPLILTTCYQVFSQAWMLSAVKEFDAEDKEGFFSKTYAVYNALIVGVCSGLILFNIPLAKILFAKEFFEAWRYSSVCLLWVMFNALTSFLGNLFAAVKESKVIAVTTIVSAVCNVVLNATLTPLFGVMGAAVATVISYAIMWAIRLVVIKKYINLKVSLLKDIVVYALLVLQVFVEHLPGHLYIGQIVILAVIFGLNAKEIINILKVMKRKFLKR